MPASASHQVQAPTEPRSARFRYTRGKCDRCSAFELHRSRPRTILEKVISAASPLHPMRCPACGRRRLRLASAAHPRPPAPALPALHQVERSRLRSGSRRARRRRRLTLVIGASALALALAVYVALG